MANARNTRCYKTDRTREFWVMNGNSAIAETFLIASLVIAFKLFEDDTYRQINVES